MTRSSLRGVPSYSAAIGKSAGSAAPRLHHNLRPLSPWHSHSVTFQPPEPNSLLKSVAYVTTRQFTHSPSIAAPSRTLLFRISDRSHSRRKSEQTLSLVVFERQQKMGFLGVHQSKTEERLLAALLFVVPHRVDHLNFVQLAGRHDVVAKIRIADDHVEYHVACSEQHKIEAPLIFVALRQKLVDVAERNFATPQGSPELFLQRRVIDLHGLFIKPRRRRSGILSHFKNLIRRHQSCHLCRPFIRTILLTCGTPCLHGPGDADQSKAGPCKLQENESHPLIHNRDNPQQQRSDNIEREVSRVQLTPNPTL